MLYINPNELLAYLYAQKTLTIGYIEPGKLKFTKLTGFGNLGRFIPILKLKFMLWFAIFRCLMDVEGYKMGFNPELVLVSLITKHTL
jgi:hypothetical protein